MKRVRLPWKISTVVLESAKKLIKVNEHISRITVLLGYILKLK